jgi:hypothetical protein
MKLNMKKTLKQLAVLTTGLGLLSMNTFADSFASLVGNSTTQFAAGTNLISSIAYIAGIGFAFKGILKLKEHNESKGQVPLSNAIFLFLAAGCCLGLPTIVSASATTALGSGTRTGINNSNALANIN